MQMERPQGRPPKENRPASPERSQILEEVYRKYHKQLIAWCIYKLMKRTADPNTKSTAEEIVADVYQHLLTDNTAVDLGRSGGEIKNFLNIVLENAITNHITKVQAQKRNPVGGKVSLEEILDEPEDSEITSRLQGYFLAPSSIPQEEKESNYAKIDRAMHELEKKYPKMADIIEKRYKLDFTLQEIGDTYGNTRQNIEMLEKKAFAKLRQFIKHGIMS